MKITITDHAAEKINQYRIGKDGWLKLKYDAEECGCVMCGVTNLWLVNELKKMTMKSKRIMGAFTLKNQKRFFWMT